MKCRIFALCVLLAGSAAMAQAQAAPGSFSIKCNPSLVDYKFSATQQIATTTSTTDAAINGVPFKGLTFSTAAQIGATENLIYGVIVGTLANGDLVFFQYSVVSHHAVNSPSGTGPMSYKIVGGTGAANGISGSGNCTAAGATGLGSEFSCLGTYATH
jgi:hypothetical protein